MANKINRNQFIKLTTLGTVGFIINSCNNDSKKNTKKEIATNAPILTINDSVAVTSFTDNDVIFYKKEEANYENLRIGFNKRVQKYPLVIALCKTELGVVAAVKYAKENKLAVSIKSGGKCL